MEVRAFDSRGRVSMRMNGRVNSVVEQRMRDADDADMLFGGFFSGNADTLSLDGD